MAKFNIEKIKDIVNLTRNLAVNLRNLTFDDNFRGFKATLTISSGSEGRIRNQLNFVPTEYIVTSIDGDAVISKGTSEWDSNYLYLYNNGASSVTITVRFF